MSFFYIGIKIDEMIKNNILNYRINLYYNLWKKTNIIIELIIILNILSYLYELFIKVYIKIIKLNHASKF